MFKQLGYHYIVEAIVKNQNILSDEEFFKNLLHNTQTICNMNILNYNYHKFFPHGLTQILVLAESHISVHTFPEYFYQQFDIFTCSDTDPIIGVDYLADQLKLYQDLIQYDVKFIKRGIPTIFSNGTMKNAQKIYKYLDPEIINTLTHHT